MTDHWDEAAARIVEARLTRTPLDSLPPAMRPQSEADGYRLQDRVRRLLSDRLGRSVGWKIGCTSQVMQDYLGVDHPCAGTVYASSLKPSGAALPSADFVRPGVECEIDVELAHPLPASRAPFDLPTVSAAIGSIFAAIEIVDDRYVDWRSLGVPTLLADDFFHAGLVLGERLPNWRAHDDVARLSGDLASLSGVLRVNGAEVARGLGRDIMGDPLRALVWLANHAAEQGAGLPAGAVVSLGSLVQTKWLIPGDHVEIEIERLGRVSLALSAP